MLHSLLSDLSAWTRNFLDNAPFHVREETITETLLVELNSARHHRISVTKASVREESVDGMDWAMAMQVEGAWLVAYVQAKNMFGSRWGTYSDLRNHKASTQARKLIRSASLFGAAPLYAFYNYGVAPFTTGSPVSLDACSRSPLSQGAGPPATSRSSAMGVTIAHAEDVLNFAIIPPASNQRATNLNRFAMPWECLACPALLTSRIAEDDASLLRRLVAGRIAQDQPERADPPAGWTLDPPIWVEMALEGANPFDADEAPDVQFLVVIGAGNQ